MTLFRRIISRYRLRRAIANLAGTKVLQALETVHPDLSFVQIGANDGKMMDPIRSAILGNQWRGLVVEPVPDLFDALRNNYASVLERVLPVNVAVSGKSGVSVFYHLHDASGLPGLPDWAAGLGSFRRDVILSHRDRLPAIEEYLQAIEVPCMTWDELCVAHGVEDVDLLVTDTEGYDFEILRQLDYDRYRPFLVIYEHHHFDQDTDDSCRLMLSNAGYRLFREGLDTWAIDMRTSDPRYQGIKQELAKWVSESRYAGPI